jgi:hypothetical protein
MRAIALVVLLFSSTAFAQSQFPGVAPSVPSPFTPPPQLGGAPAPPTALPVPRVSPTVPSRLVTRPRGRPVEVPGGPSNFSNQVERCLDAGANAGLGPNERAAFTRHCVQ